MKRNVTKYQQSQLDIRGLNKQFGTFQVLSDVSFSVLPFEILGLIGPNGAGKSTLLECITGLLPLDSGTISRKGEPLPVAQRKEVIWFQPDSILPFAKQRITVILSFFRQAHGMQAEYLQQLVTRLQLTSVLDKPLNTLSKGYRRRVLLALALLSNQQVLMLDEPFDGLDLRQSLLVMDLLRESCKERAMILSIHQLAEAEKICDRFLLLDQGHLLGIGTLDELRQQTSLGLNASLEEVFLAVT